MTKMLPTIVLLLALAPGSLSTAQTETEKAAAAKDFQVFWNVFRQAVKDNDEEKVALMTRFPFETEDLGQNVKKHTKESFPNVLDKLLQADYEYYSGGRLERETKRRFIERTVTITSKDVGTKSFVRVGDFEFQKAKGKWLFTKGYVDE
jgi:hypothetical protein